VKTLSDTNRATMPRHEPDLRREDHKQNDEGRYRWCRADLKYG